MLRGIVTCKCAYCGAEFNALDIEWNATAKSAPVRCPECGQYNDINLCRSGLGLGWLTRLFRKTKGL